MGRRAATSTSTSTSLSPSSITPSTSSSFHSSASSPSSSLPSHLISNELWKYFQIYQILDPIWCFLTKNKTACTITNLQRMIRSHSQEVDLFAMLQRLKIICDPFLLLTPPPDALDSPLDHQHYLLSYSKFHGITPVCLLVEI